MELVRLTKHIDLGDSISLAIKPPGDHVGIVYRRSKSRELRMLHLAWHFDVRDEPANPKYACLEMVIDPDWAPLVPNLCELVAKKYTGVGLAYSVHYRGDRFDLTTGALLTPKGRGFTCATFVMALFDSLGHRLVETEAWPSRDDDREWHESILVSLERMHPTFKEHIAAERADLPCARFRPAEVAAAGTSCSLPVDFQYAVRVGKAIVEKVGVSTG